MYICTVSIFVLPLNQVSNIANRNNQNFKKMNLQSLIIENQSKVQQIIQLVNNVTNGELTVDANGQLSWNTEDAYNNQDEILESVYEAIETEIEL